MSDHQKLFEQRLQRLQQKLSSQQVLFVSNPFDLRYLCGFVTLTPFEREAYLLVSKHKIILFLSAFSNHFAIKNVEQKKFGYWQPLSNSIQDFLAKTDKEAKIYLDPRTLTISELDQIRQSVRHEQCSFEEVPYVKDLRKIKDDTEIGLLRIANASTHHALEKTFQQLEIGMTEIEVQHIFESLLDRSPTQPLAFPTIVAFGEHTALPHHQPTTRTLKNDEPVLIDCGNTYQAYCADVTRTIWFGEKPNTEFVKIENIVKEAYAKTVAVFTSHFTGEDVLMNIGTGGVRACDLDNACRSFIQEKGYGDKFIHTTGHGVGLYIHESPSLSNRDETLLKPGMVITVEPGIYIPNKFGYRFENSLVITEKGYEELGT